MLAILRGKLAEHVPREYGRFENQVDAIFQKIQQVIIQKVKENAKANGSK